MQGIEWVPLRNKCMQFKCISACSGSKSTNKLLTEVLLGMDIEYRVRRKNKVKERGFAPFVCVC